MVSRLISIAIISVFLSGCMHSGMMHGGMGMHGSGKVIIPDRQSMDMDLNALIGEAAAVVPGEPAGTTIAVLEITVGNLGVDPESIRQKLITQIVNRGDLSVVTRDHMTDLLREKGLAQAGVVSDSTLVRSGSLIGVDRFLAGKLFREENNLVLIIHTIDSKDGVISWSRTLSRKLVETGRQ